MCQHHYGTGQTRPGFLSYCATVLRCRSFTSCLHPAPSSEPCLAESRASKQGGLD